MDKYERFGKRYAKDKGHIIEENNGKIYVFEKGGRGDLFDEPDQIHNNWKDYTRWNFGRDLRRKRLRNNKSYKRLKPF